MLGSRQNSFVDPRKVACSQLGQEQSCQGQCSQSPALTVRAQQERPAAWLGFWFCTQAEDRGRSPEDGTEPPATQRPVCLSRAEGGPSAGAPLFSGIGPRCPKEVRVPSPLQGTAVCYEVIPEIQANPLPHPFHQNCGSEYKENLASALPASGAFTVSQNSVRPGFMAIALERQADTGLELDMNLHLPVLKPTSLSQRITFLPACISGV
ncbi:unnamed protein product [Rangifer tarandus platyrhynchus]|uniref:Uncharacterized protein n=1 Tax=Rangifer tarandus platyrhynchus TaxID=3082113 RepID=A0ACB1MK09_RANTA